MLKRSSLLPFILIATLSLRAQNPSVAAVVNGAGFTAPVTAGSTASIFGSHLARAGTNSAQTTAPWPTSLGGSSVRINGTLVPVAFVSPGQINFQVPWELTGQVQASLTVAASSSVSTTFTINL